MEARYIIGMKPVGHDANLSIVDANTGELIFCMALERLTRKKRDPGSILPLIRVALRFLKIEPSQVIAVCVPILPLDVEKMVGIINKAYNEGKISGRPKSYRLAASGLATDYQLYLDMSRTMFPNADTEQLNHHLCHIASSYYLSPFESAALATFDGRGEYQTTVIYHGQNGKITKLAEQLVPYSIGSLYMQFSYLFGLGAREGGKTMGLAAYGDPDRFYHVFRDEIINIDENGYYEINPSMVLGEWNPLVYAIPISLFGVEKDIGRGNYQMG